jgi:hypothetical protein
MTYTLTIPSWHPARLNQLLGSVRARIRLKKSDRELVTWYSKAAGIPLANGPRRVSLRITLGPRQRAGDPDAYWKSTLDALVCAGLLLDDSRKWVQLGDVLFERGPERMTAIVLEDLGVKTLCGQSLECTKSFRPGCSEKER